MLYFNLLPKKIQQDTIYNHKNYLVFRYGKLLIILLLILTAFLIFILLFTNSKNKNFEQELLFIKQNPTILEIKKTENDIKQFNEELLSTIKPTQKNRKLSTILIELSNIAPMDISLNSLIASNEKDLILTGEAKNRKALLSFEEALKNSKIFTDIISPLSNFSKNTDLDFKIDITINYDANI